MVLAKDIMKKRKQYRDRKEKRNKKAEREKPPKKRSRKNPRKKLIIQHPSPDASPDVDALFDITSYDCNECGESLELEECYPVKKRKTPKDSKFFCKKCFKNATEVLDAIDLTAGKDKQDKAPAKKKAKTNTTKSKKSKAKTTKSKKSKTKTTKSQPKYNVGDYVLAQYPGYGDERFRAEIYSKFAGKYHVYYLEDGAHQKNVDEDALVKVADTESWTNRKRCDFLNIAFKRKGEEGTWKAVEVGKRHHLNKYGIKPVDKPADKLVWLAVSVVQKLIHESEKNQSSS